jgi:hypothetical protein
MILLWGSRRDGPLSSVATSLDALNRRAVFIDEMEPFHTELRITADGDLCGWIATGDLVLDVEAIKAAYIRPHDRRRSHRVGAPESGNRAHQQWDLSWDALWTWCDMAQVPVVNKPAAMSGCFSKTRQLPIIVSAGFAVPETLVTTDPDAATEFWNRHDAVVYKSISSTRSIVSRLTPSHRQRLADLRWCPGQFQEFVPGVDHRVHVVGERIFCSTIRSTADDYRYAGTQGDTVEISPSCVSDECSERCLELSRKFDLRVAGIDLRLAPDGTWYCFEINPSPAFSYYDREASRPIANGIAALLTERVASGAPHA